MNKVRISDDGWMLSENMLSILIYLIMIGAGAVIAYMVFSSSKVAQMEQALSTMTMQIQGLYAGSSSYDGLSSSVVINAGAVPKKIIKGQTLKTPWGGNITVSPGTDTTTFTIKMEGIGREDCSKLAVFQSDLWEQVSVNSKVYSRENLSVSNIVGSCTANNNIIIYTAR